MSWDDVINKLKELEGHDSYQASLDEKMPLGDYLKNINNLLLTGFHEQNGEIFAEGIHGLACYRKNVIGETD